MPPDTQQVSDPIVAFVGPLSGEESIVAVPMAQAALAGCYATARAVRSEVAFLAADDGRDPDRAARIVAALSADPRVIGIVGPKNSGSAAAAIPAASAGRLPLVLPAATADELCDEGGGLVFRLCATDRATAATAVDLCGDLGISRLAVRADDTRYGIGLARSVRACAEAEGLSITSDIREAEAVFHAMGEIEEAAALLELESSGYRGVRIGAQGGPGSPLGWLARGAAEGAYELYAGAVLEGADTVYTGESHDAAALLVRAHAAAGDRGAMAEWLRDSATDGRTGTLRFEADGERTGATVTLWRIDGERTVPAQQTGASQPAAQSG